MTVGELLKVMEAQGDRLATLESERVELEEAKRELEEALGKLAHENKVLADQLQVLLNSMFRKKSERIDPRQLRLFLEEMTASEEPEAEPEPESTRESPAGKGKGHGRKPFPDDAPRVIEELSLPEEERVCDDCGCDLVDIGEDVTERGHLIPAQMIVRKYVRKKWACPKGHQIKTADLPPSLVDKCKYEPSVYAHVAVAKYGDHLPLHRLSGIFLRYGFDLPKQTMWEMLRRLDEVVISSITGQMRKELLEEPIIHADETPVVARLEGKKGSRKAYLWHYGCREKQMFDFTMTRSRDGPTGFLGHWKGTLVTDGYAGYDEIVRRNGLVRAGCWAHARRHFKEALDTGSRGAARVLVPVQRLFRVEGAVRKRAAARNLDEPAKLELLLQVRQKTSLRLMAKIRALLEELVRERSTLPKSLLGKALTYVDRQWEPLTRFLEDADLPIHNNNAERSIRHVALGRKNWLFFGSPRGGEVGKNITSVMLTCKVLGIDPEAYLEDVIRRIDTTPQSQIASLTPWAWADEQRVKRASNPVA